SLLEKGVVDALVVDGRRLGTAVGAIVAHDEVATHCGNLVRVGRLLAVRPLHVAPVLAGGDGIRIGVATVAKRKQRGRVVGGAKRSEEHTSELQSLTNLVCRL